MILKGRGVTFQLTPGNDVFKEAAHDFAGACLGQAGGKNDLVRFGNGADFSSDVVPKFLRELVGGLNAFFQRYKGDARKSMYLRSCG